MRSTSNKYKPYSEEEINKFKKILVIQTAFIGDAILTSSFIRALKEYMPDSSIDILVIPETENIFKKNRRLNRVIVFDKRRLSKRIGSFLKALLVIKREKYDLAFSVQSSFTSSMLMLIPGIKERVGFHFQKFITRSIIHIRGLHMRLRILRLMEVLSNKKFDDRTEIFWNYEEEEKALSLTSKFYGRKIIGIAPGSAMNTKQYPEKYYGEVISKLLRYNVVIFLLGGSNDSVIGKRLSAISNEQIINVAGELTLLESAALINKLDLLVSSDSAPMHIANAVGTDVIAIFGPTVKELGFFPYRKKDKILEVELECRPCGKHGHKECPLKHFRCMLDLKPEVVFDEIKKSLRID